MVGVDQRLQVVLIEVPAAGSPKTVHGSKPPAYPANQREAWRPRTSPPVNRKAEGLRRLLNEFQRQDQVVREMMRPGAR